MALEANLEVSDSSTFEWNGDKLKLMSAYGEDSPSDAGDQTHQLECENRQLNSQGYRVVAQSEQLERVTDLICV